MFTVSMFSTDWSREHAFLSLLMHFHQFLGAFTCHSVSALISYKYSVAIELHSAAHQCFFFWHIFSPLLTNNLEINKSLICHSRLILIHWKSMTSSLKNGKTWLTAE